VIAVLFETVCKKLRIIHPSHSFAEGRHHNDGRDRWNVTDERIFFMLAAVVIVIGIAAAVMAARQ